MAGVHISPALVVPAAGFVDQAGVIAKYAGVDGMTVTSAMKGLGAAVKNGLDTVNAGDWSTIAGTNGNFGLEEGDYVGLPTDEASWNFSTFTMDEYNTVLEKIRNGEIKVDNTSDDATKPTTSTTITVTTFPMQRPFEHFPDTQSSGTLHCCFDPHFCEHTPPQSTSVSSGDSLPS